MTKLGRLSLIVAMACASAALAPSASAANAPAQSRPEATAASEAFEKGLRHFKKKEYEAARVYFQQAYTAVPAEGTLQNLALAEFWTRRYVDALRHFKAYVKRPFVDTEFVQKDLPKILQRCQEKTAHARVSTSPRAIVLLDGEPVADLADVLDMAPGTHTLVARFETDETRTLTVAAGETVDIAFRAPEKAPVAAAPPPPPRPPAIAHEPVAPPAKPVPASDWSPRKTVAVGLGIGAAVALVTGGAFAGVALSDSSKANDAQSALGPHGCTLPTAPECARLRDLEGSQNRNSSIAYAGLGAGAALGTAAVVLWFLPTKAEPRKGRLWLSPSFGATGTAFTAGGMF